MSAVHKDLVFGETIGTDAYPSRLMRRPFRNETLPTEPFRHGINISVISGQSAKLSERMQFARYACPASELRNDERIGFAPPIGLLRETRSPSPSSKASGEQRTVRRTAAARTPTLHPARCQPAPQRAAGSAAW